jgi:hypothetical protein
MHSDITMLSELMAQEAGLFRKMIQALEVEKGAAIQADLGTLDDSRLEKVSCADGLKMTAGRKERAIERVAGELKVPAGMHTFEALVDLLDRGTNDKLRAMQAEVASLAKIADSKNRENAVYLEQGLKMARGSLALVENICNPQTEYQKTGQVKPGRSSGRLLSRKY